MNEKLKKILSGVGVLAAFGLGGAAIAGAQTDKTADKPAVSQSKAAESEDGEQNEANEADEQVTGRDADRAGQAALQSVGGGKVLEVERETPDQGADKPEPGDKPDSAEERAMEQNGAYAVEVQKKADGTTVDVVLDDQFKVIGTEQGDEQNGEQEGDQNEEQDGESSSEPAEAAAQR